MLVLGSTGSIGVQALEVIDACPGLVACGLSCGTRLERMADQARERGIAHTSAAVGGGSVPWSADLGALIDACEPDLVLNGLVGAAGLRPTLAALERGIDVALANKESLVVGGELVREVRLRTSARLVPVDSEHSALFQLIEGAGAERVERVTLTASGGPFRGRAREDLAGVTVAEALRHPTWAMGAKITIDSATLMNKGLEVIEAHHLFEVAYDRIDVLVHPQSIVHAMVTLLDGSVLAHCGDADMRVPIGHALRHPEPPPAREPFDFAGRELSFEHPDRDAFRCLDLACEAGRVGGTAPAILNAANEVAVEAFLAGRAGFLDIAALVEGALGAVPASPAATLGDVLAADRAARETVAARLAGR